MPERRKNLKRQRQMSMKAQLLQILIVLIALAAETVAWSPNQKPFVSRRNPQLSRVSKNHKKIAPKELTTQNMLKSPSLSTRRDSKMKLSNSVLASCDTLPSFPTAHGLLSPETVSRLEASIGNNDAVEMFLRTYRRSGPLSCVHYLSDPLVLPHLTSAMREIAA